MSQMKSIAMFDGKLTIKEIDIPVPGPGQVLVRSLACGICGSDLHIARHTEDVLSIYKTLGILAEDNNNTEVLLGHEFAAEVVSYGPETKGELEVGTHVTSVPVLLSEGGVGVGVTPGVHGAYSEFFIVDEALLLPIPEQVPAEAAAITEPLAVGLHAVNRADINEGDVALVAGCGPIGLAAIAALKLKGVKHIVASDLQDSKKELAMKFGATAFANPAKEDEVVMATQLAANNKVIIIECVGVHKLINNFIMRAPAKAQLIITGIHTTPTDINFAFATVKEMDIKCSYYYSPEEFAQSLQNIAEGKIDWRLMMTGKVGLDGTPSAFDSLLKPNEHIKVIVEPWRNGELEVC